MSLGVMPTRDASNRRILGGAAVAVGLVGGVVFVWAAIDLLLLIFAAILVAQLLLALSDALRR